MKKFLSSLCLVCFVSPQLVNAEALDVLIQEKAIETYGSTMPDYGSFDVVFHSGSIKEAMVISAFWMDISTGQFVANAVTQDGGVRRVGGLALLGLEVPVPNRRMLPDEIITKQDITVERLPYARVGSYAVIETKSLIGKQVKRILSKGRPIMTQSIMEQRIIGRGDLIKIRYSDGLLKVTAPGRALSDASRGQDIKIVNLVGNKTLIGIASAEGLVDIIK